MNTDGTGFHSCKECHKSKGKENNWKTEETLVQTAVTVETEGSKGPIRDIYDDDDDDDDVA